MCDCVSGICILQFAECAICIKHFFAAFRVSYCFFATMSLAEFVKAVPWDVKDETWDQAIIDNLSANDIKVDLFIVSFID